MPAIAQRSPRLRRRVQVGLRILYPLVASLAIHVPPPFIHSFSTG